MTRGEHEPTPSPRTAPVPSAEALPPVPPPAEHARAGQDPVSQGIETTDANTPAEGAGAPAAPADDPNPRTAQLPTVDHVVTNSRADRPRQAQHQDPDPLRDPEDEHPAPGPGARPVSAAEAALALKRKRGEEIPEHAPITTTMPVLPQHTARTTSEVRDAARRLETRLLGAERSLRRREVAAGVGVSLHSARKIWRALGLPRVGDDEVAYSEADEDALATIIEQVRSHRLSEDAVLSITRSLGQFTDRMVIWQIEAIVEDLVQNQGMTDAEARRQVLMVLDDLVEPIEEVMLYIYRRNLADAVQRQLVRAEEGLRSSETGRDGTEDDTTLPLARAVGFADMVSFTSLSRGMRERELAKLVQRFETRSAEIITVAGGRLVKTIGDEVLYVAETPQAGAEIALALADAFAPDEGMPPVRVGVVWGRILSRLGDIYGATVNMAARLTARAEPGEVLTDALTAQVLRADDRFVLQERPPVELQGFGEMTPYELLPGKGPRLELD